MEQQVASQVRGGNGLGNEKEKMMEGGGSLHSWGGSEGTWTVERRQPMATRTLRLDNEEVPRCQTTPFTLDGSDPKVSTS